METEAGLWVAGGGGAGSAQAGVGDPRHGVRQRPAEHPDSADPVHGGRAGGGGSGADAYAQAFLDYRSAQSASSRKHQLGSLQSQINAVQKSLNAATAALKSQETATDAQVQVQLYTTRLSALQDSVGQLQTNVADQTPGSVISPAGSRLSAVAPSTIALVALGGLLGLALGAALALWRERSDDRLRVSEHQTAGGVPRIGYLPFAGRQAAQGGGVLSAQGNQAADGSDRQLAHRRGRPRRAPASGDRLHRRQ